MIDRGRVAYAALGKILNPISHKILRACMVTKPKKATEGSVEAVYLFIAELLGIKKTAKGKQLTRKSKAAAGKAAYSKGKLLSLDLSKDEDRDKAYENIWLSRLYADLKGILDGSDPFHRVPIELGFQSP